MGHHKGMKWFRQGVKAEVQRSVHGFDSRHLQSYIEFTSTWCRMGRAKNSNKNYNNPTYKVLDKLVGESRQTNWSFTQVEGGVIQQYRES